MYILCIPEISLFIMVEMGVYFTLTCLPNGSPVHTRNFTIYNGGNGGIFYIDLFT